MTPKQFRTLFHILHNTDLAALENAGVIKSSHIGGSDWRRFNNNLTGFVLKLPEDRLERLVALVHAEGLQP